MPKKRPTKQPVRRVKKRGDHARAYQKWEKGFVLAGLLLLGFVLFGRTLAYDFVTWDDDYNVYRNPMVIQPQHGISRLWSGPVGAFYIPVTYTVWHLLAQLSPKMGTQISAGAFSDSPKPRLFHAFNLALHVLNGWLVFLILLHGLPNRPRTFWSALAGAVFFVIHPVQVEPVAWVSGLRDLLVAFFSLGALYAYLRFHQHKDFRLYALATVSFVLALLSKPSAAVWPLVVGGTAVFFFRTPVKQAVRELAPWMLAVVPILFWTISLQQPDLTRTAPFWFRPLYLWDGWAFAVQKLAFPYPLLHSYVRVPETILSDPWLIAKWALPLLVGASLFWLPKSWRSPAAFGLAFFLLTQLPTSGLFPNISQKESSLYDRYLYLALLFPAWGVGWLTSYFWTDTRLRALGVVFALLFVVSLNQVGYWRDSPTLFNHLIREFPDQDSGYRGLGMYHLQAGNWDKAVHHLTKATERNPKDKTAQEVLQQLNNYADAPSFLMKLTQERYKSGDYAGMLYFLNKIHDIDPNHRQAFNIKALALMKMKRPEAAIAILQHAITLDPSFAEAHNNLAGLYLNLGQPEKAQIHMQLARTLNPQFQGSQENMDQIQDALKARTTTSAKTESNPASPKPSSTPRRP